MVILGVDPGSRAVGYGLLEGAGGAWCHRASGTIRPPARGSLAARLAVLDAAMRDLIARHEPVEVAVEALFHAHSPQAAIVMGHARGVILVAARASGAEVAEYAPREVKLAIAGSGAASKQQVREMVRRLVAVPARLGLDAADALAVALCHANRRANRIGASGQAGGGSSGGAGTARDSGAGAGR